MRLRGHIGRLLALGLLPALLFSGAVPGWTLFLCSMSGVTHAEPCCDGDDGVETGLAYDTISEPGCCLKFDTQIERLSWTPQGVHWAALPPPVVRPIEIEPPASSSVLEAPEAAPLLATGPPILLKKQTFLI